MAECCCLRSPTAVHEAVLTSGVLCMEPVELNRQLLEAVWQATNVKDPASREQHAAAALGELLQTAAGVPLPLQPQYHDQAAALVERCPLLWTVPADRLRAAWASLCRLGLTDSQVTPLVRSFPVALSVDWGGAMMQRRAAFFQEVLGLALAEGVGINPRYATASLARMEMRTAILKQERPAVWAAALRRGAIAVLDLLTGPRRSFCRRAGCTPEELGEFERRWRGRRGK